MARRRMVSLILSIVMLIGIFPMNISAATNNKMLRTVYLHAQGENPQKETTNISTVDMGDTVDLYFAVDDPNMGDYDSATGTHKEPQYDMNGYTLQIYFDEEYFNFASTTAPYIIYDVPDETIDPSDKEDVNKGEDNTVIGGAGSDTTIPDVPTSKGYFVYREGNEGTYTLGSKTYKTAYITVFFSGGYLPQKRDDQNWYNLAKLPLTPIKPGSTEVFINIDNDDKAFPLELFAKNEKSDELEDQTFDFNAVNGGYHTITIKESSKPAPPIATPAAGKYPELVEVSLSAEDGCDIFYTDNGEDPATHPSRIKYTGPFTLTEDKLIRACAYRKGKYSSTVDYKYEILPDRPYLFEQTDEGKALLPNINRLSSKTLFYISDDEVYRQIIDDSEVYYTFSDLPLPEDKTTISTEGNAETEWVKVYKPLPVVEIDKNCTIRLVTDKLGHISDEAEYYFSIKPLAPESNFTSGIYDHKIDVELSSKTEGATIYYTTDGSDPKTSSDRREYKDIPITLDKDTTIRAISFYEGEWSDSASFYYLFNFYDDYGVNAFYPSGVYEGSVNVTLTPNNPEYTVMYHMGDGKWEKYTEVIIVDEDTLITAKAVEFDADSNVVSEGEEYYFTYNIKPQPPEFVPESTQFTNANKITIYTPESTEDTTEDYDLFYTLDGSDPTTSGKKADDESDSAVIDINKYTVVTAAVRKNGESWSTVVTHSYDIVTLKPVKPLTTLLPGYYTHKIGGEGFATQFMPVPNNTKIYYTISYDGGLCPDPIPDTEGTYPYDSEASPFIEVKGNTVIRAIAVNAFGVKSDVGIFSYTVTPEAPKAAPSATISGSTLPVVPVDAVKGSTVKYTIGDFTNEFPNADDERFYIDTNTGNAYRDKECTQPLGDSSANTNSDSVTLEISSSLNGVESDINRYTYALSDSAVLAPPYADKETGTYEEIKIDDDNNILKVMLYSLNNGGTIQYRIDNEGEWTDYADGGLLFKEDTILQLRHKKDDNYSAVVSYVYNFVPLAPVITLPSGTYLASDNIETRIAYDERIPQKNYNIFYRRNGDPKDYKYNFSDIEPEELGIDHTMTVKAYVLNEDTGRVSKNTIHYYIIESGNAMSGSVFIADPYYTDWVNGGKISVHKLGSGDYAEGIKLLSPNKTADIHYYYAYTRTDGQTVEINPTVYDVNRPIIPTELMDDITIVAWLEDESGRIEGSNSVFYIDFLHLGVPTTSLEETGKVEFSKGTKYTLKNYPTDEDVILYYTLDGSDPTDGYNENRVAYSGEELTLNSATTVRVVYYRDGVYGDDATYKYTVPTTIHTGGGGGGYRGGTTTIDNTRKYTSDIFGNEHPTHIGYINGYPDGSVKPEGDITREEITSILYRITNHEYEKPFVATGDAFPDVESGRWSAHDIEYMADKEIVNGYPDGEFKPSRNLSRAEFAALIFRFANIEKADIENPFTDLDDAHWAYSEILALTNSGLMEGYPDKTYKPENNITRAEVMTVVNKLLGRKPLESYVKELHFNPYNDLDEDKWYYVTVLEATITHNYWLNDTGYEYKWEDWK